MPEPIVLPAAGGSPSPPSPVTGVRYRNLLADELGLYSSTTVTTTATTADADRQVILSDFGFDGVSQDYLDRSYLYVKDGDQAGLQRRVLSGTFDGPIQSMLIDKPYSAPLQSGTAVEITWPLPVKRHMNVRGLFELVNEALRMCWVPVRITTTGNNTYSYDLSAYPWIEQPDQIYGIYDTVLTTPQLPYQLSSYDYSIREFGAARSLLVHRLYTTAETFEIYAVVRGDRYLSDGTTWTFRTTPGLLNDTEQAAVPEAWVLAFGMVKALQQWAKLVHADRRMSREERQETLADLAQRRDMWARAAYQIKTYEFPQAPPRPAHGLAGTDRVWPNSDNWLMDPRYW